MTTLMSKTPTDSGAVGFLLKQTSSHDVCRAIREIQKGKTFFSPSISKHLDRLNPTLFGRAGCSSGNCPATSREMEVLQLIAEGKANKETAAELGIGIKTVEKHREHLMESSTSTTPPASPATPSARASSRAVFN